MNLKKATTFALIGVWLDLLVLIAIWVINTFNLVVSDHIWIYRSIPLVVDLLSTIPIIVFLTVLQKKQKGDSNV